MKQFRLEYCQTPTELTFFSPRNNNNNNDNNCIYFSYVNQTSLICVIRLKQIRKEGAYSQSIIVIVNHSLLEGTLPVNLLKVHLSKIVSHNGDEDQRRRSETKT